MFQKFKLERKHIIIGICALIVIITGASLLRINHNQGIVDSYEALSHPLPERTRLALFESVWHKYTGYTRDRFVTEGDAIRAEQTIKSAYNFMIGADIVLLIALGVLVLPPLVSKRFNLRN